MGRFAEAAGAYEQTVRLQPDNASAYSNLGFVYDRLGKLPQSLEALQKAVRLKPDDAVAHNNLGASFYKASIPDAIDSFTNAVRLNRVIEALTTCAVY